MVVPVECFIDEFVTFLNNQFNNSNRFLVYVVSCLNRLYWLGEVYKIITALAQPPNLKGSFPNSSESPHLPAASSSDPNPAT